MKNLIPFMKSDPTVNVVRLQGAIMNNGQGLDDPSLAGVLQKAFTRCKLTAPAARLCNPRLSPRAFGAWPRKKKCPLSPLSKTSLPLAGIGWRPRRMRFSLMRPRLSAQSA